MASPRDIKVDNHQRSHTLFFRPAPRKCPSRPLDGPLQQVFLLLSKCESDARIMELFQVVCSIGRLYRLTYFPVSQTASCS